MNEPVKQGRIAIRKEGSLVTAYYAMPDTMEGAIYLASVSKKALDAVPEAFAQFQTMLRTIVTGIFKLEGIKVDDWQKPEPAPEHERAGEG